MTRRLLACLLAAAVAAAFGACGAKEDEVARAPSTERLTLMLDYFPNADHAGIYAAQATGALRQVGIDLRIQAPSDPATPLKLLASGRVDLAISYEPELLLARDKGLRVVSVAALVQKPLTSLISLPRARIGGPGDLAGKTVATAGIPYQSAYLRTILDKAGIDPGAVKEVNVGFNLVPSLLSRRADAVLGAFWNYEGVELRRRDRKPVILRMERLGVPTYNELIVVAREETLRERGPVIRRLLQGLARGHEALREDPDAGIDPLLQANRDLERGLQEAVVRETLPVFFPADDQRPWGWHDPREWRRYSAWMLENDLLRKPAAPTSLTNEFLPGEGI